MTFTLDTVDVATNVYATGGGQSPRHVGVTSNGVRWYGFRSNGNFNFFYSPDGGTTRTWAGTMSQTFNGIITCGTEFSFFIDEDDYMHVAYAKHDASGNDGRTYKAWICYRRGTPNAGRTDYTWSTEQTIVGSDYWHVPDVVAHREGTGWKAHVVYSYNWTNNRQILAYSRFDITAAGTISPDQMNLFLHDVTSSDDQPTFPSIELRHAGNGKTPQTVYGLPKPDLFITYALGTVTRFVRMDYSQQTGTWTSQGPETVTTAYFNNHSATAVMTVLYEHHRWCKVLYAPNSDGTGTAIVLGELGDNALSTQVFVIYEQTITLTGSSGSWPGYAISGSCYSGSAALRQDGHVAFLGISTWNPPNSTVTLGYIDRHTPGSRFRTDTDTIDTSNTEAQASLLQYPTTQLDGLFTDGNANPYNVQLVRESLSNVYVWWQGAWTKAVRYINTGGAWLAHSPTKL